ncbi:MAG: helix-turn-helix transcriptional regulator [Nocardia sp.]|uniref:winged helix-turn-helix transcriptional regulator n=1 Tax=Nocardia sp. TaxID=1821 RepID=UPI0026158B66|nr:helix-turn-helix domain-containing protein [Nocardia sp.]MCU1645941.1 helix-turn-helix transcriptional regulator [Nocardia sp.]
MGEAEHRHLVRIQGLRHGGGPLRTEFDHGLSLFGTAGVLGDRPKLFGEIRRLRTGVSEKVLAENLRHLESSGVVHREIPPRVEYSLTPLGEDLNLALRPLEHWGDRNRTRLLAPTP